MNFIVSQGGKLTGDMFAAHVLGHLRSMFLIQAKKHNLTEKISVDESLFSTAPLLLIVGTPRTHKTSKVREIAQKNSTTVLGLFHHTSLWAAAMDDVIFGVWKGEHKRLVGEHVVHTGRSPNRFETTQFFLQAQKKVTQLIISLAFSRVGISPFSKENIVASAKRQAARLGCAAEFEKADEDSHCEEENTTSHKDTADCIETEDSNEKQCTIALCGTTLRFNNQPVESFFATYSKDEKNKFAEDFLNAALDVFDQLTGMSSEKRILRAGLECMISENQKRKEKYLQKKKAEETALAAVSDSYRSARDLWNKNENGEELPPLVFTTAEFNKFNFEDNEDGCLELKQWEKNITSRWELVSIRIRNREKAGGMIAGTDALGLEMLGNEIPELLKVIRKRRRTQNSIIKKKKKATKKEEKRNKRKREAKERKEKEEAERKEREKKRKREAKERKEKEEAERKEREKKRQREAIEKKERERKKRRKRKIEVHYLGPMKRTPPQRPKYQCESCSLLFSAEQDGEWSWFGCERKTPKMSCIKHAASGKENPVRGCNACGWCDAYLCNLCGEKKGLKENPSKIWHCPFHVTE